MDQMMLPDEAPRVAGRITLTDIDRLNSVIRPFPLPADLTPTDVCDFSAIPDSVLLETPPQLIVHLQRTAAQGGLQVVSPRQTPMSCLMSRVKTERRQRGDHIVGSIADPDNTWPTIDDADMSFLLPDEPLPPRAANPTLREKTKTMSLTTASHMMTDPILACLVKGRAVVDILNRPDVQGDGKAVVSLLADAWGIDESMLMDLDAFTLGFEGSLLRHAIRTDDVYPVMYAPVHQQRSISVGSNEATREDLPIDSALDWRRMRVFCEAVFSLTVQVEGFVLSKMRCVPPPGDMSAPGNRPGTLAFIPAVCTAWTFSPSTFSLCPVVDKRASKPKTIPPEVLTALARYVETVNPMSHALEAGFRARARVSTLRSVAMPSEETLKSSYSIVTRSVVTTGARGRTAAAAVRNYIFEVLENCSITTAMRINRYIKIATDEVRTHLKLKEVPDMMIDRLADRFLDIGSAIRIKIVGEANLRRASPEQWWHDITAQTAARYKEMKEGTMGWARVAMYLLFKQPTDKWRKLCSAINFNVMLDAAARSVGSVALPAEKYTHQRVESAGRHVAQQISTTYASYYLGVHDVGLAISDYMMATGRERSARIIRHAAYLWALRARVFRAINVTALPGGSVAKNVNHYVATGYPVSLNLAPAPYRAYAAYRISVMKDETVPNRVKDMLPPTIEDRISRIFRDMKGPLFPCPMSELTKYIHNPPSLGNDMEEAWAMLTKDMLTVIETYGVTEEREPGPSVESSMQSSGLGLSVPMAGSAPGGKMTYWDILSLLSGERGEYVESLIKKVGPEYEDIVMEEEFSSINELVFRLKGIEQEVDAARAGSSETVA